MPRRHRRLVSCCNIIGPSTYILRSTLRARPSAAPAVRDDVRIDRSRARTAASLLVVFASKSALADPPQQRLAARVAIASLVPGMAESEVRKRLGELGWAEGSDLTYCSDEPMGEIDCPEFAEDAHGSWKVSFDHGKLARVTYDLYLDSDQESDDTRPRIDRRAAEFEAASRRSGGANRQVRLGRDNVASGHRTTWGPTRNVRRR
jgi:hypothetical protein